MLTAMVVPSLAPELKSDLRHRLRAERMAFVRALPSSARAAMERALAAVLAPEWRRARVIGSYQPMKDEIDPTVALAEAVAAGCATALPAFVERDSPMRFHAGPATERGPWGILQPALDKPLLSPDLLIVPVMAVDRRGNRVGQGQGHYDRALAALREAGLVRLIGIGWPLQLIDTPLTPDAWDIPLDAFASPNGMMEFA